MVVTLENAQTDSMLSDTEHILDLFAAVPTAADEPSYAQGSREMDESGGISGATGTGGAVGTDGTGGGGDVGRWKAGEKRTRGTCVESAKRARTSLGEQAQANLPGTQRWAKTLEWWSDRERELAEYARELDIDSFMKTSDPFAKQ